jgi:serine phosphatase RsbU (regulator of sigma subunit)
MKKAKSYFDLWISLLITMIILSNLWIIYYLQYEKINIDDIWYHIFLGVFLFQAIIILTIINNAYKKPIYELTNQVINFMSWSSKWEKININTNYSNPNIRIVLRFFDGMLNSLKNIKDEFLSWKAIKWEVQLATELQEKLLNKKLEEIPSLNVIAKSKPAWEIGWDSYDIIKWNDDYYVYVWDATGHWVWAWFVMVMVNALVSWFSKVFKRWNEILANTNEILKPRVKSNILMTLLLLRWNEAEKRLFMTWAGHEYLIVYKHNLNKCFKIKSWWLALGMTKNVHKILKEQEIRFELNDIVVLYTDWITECINQNKKDWNEVMFWEQRLIDAIEKSPTIPWAWIKTARWVFNNITIELSKFLWYKHRQYDDITLVVIHYNWGKSIVNDFSEDISKDFITEWNWN